MEKTKNEIININVIMTILIVILHSDCITYANSSTSYYQVAIILNDLISALCNFAVPTFICISCFLYFRNYNNKKYFSKIKSRIRTLAIPYFFWCSVGLLFNLFLYKSGIIGTLANEYSTFDFSFLAILKSFILPKYNLALWTIRVLFCLMLIAPILYWSITKLKKFNFVILIIAIVLINKFNISYYSFVYWLPLFYLTALVTILYPSFIKKFMNNNYKIMFFSIIAIILLTCIFFKNVNNYTVTYLWRLIAPLFIFKLDWIKNINSKLIEKISKYTFLIYATHIFAISVIRKIWSFISFNNGLLLVLYRFSTAFTSIILIVLVFKILFKLFPKFTYIISGGRNV